MTLATATSVEPPRGRKLSCSESKGEEGANFTNRVCTCAYKRFFKVNVENLSQEPLPSSLRQDLSNPELTYV